MKFGEQPTYSRQAYEDTEKGIQDVKDIAQGSDSVEELRTLVQEKKGLEAQKAELHGQAWDEANEMNKEHDALAQESAAQAETDAAEVARIRAEILGESAASEAASVEVDSDPTSPESTNFVTEMSLTEQKIQEEQNIPEEEPDFSEYEQGVVSDIRNMMKLDDFSGVFKRIFKERKRADQYQEASSGQAGFFKKLMAPKGGAVCDMEKLGSETESLLEERLKAIVAKDDLDTYKRYVSAAKSNEAVFDTDLPGGFSFGVTDFESVGPKIQEFNFGRAKQEISSFDQDSSNVSLENFVSGRARLFGNGDSQFREAILKSSESRKQFLKLAKIVSSPDSISGNTASHLQRLVSDGYLTQADIESL